MLQAEYSLLHNNVNFLTLVALTEPTYLWEAQCRSPSGTVAGRSESRAVMLRTQGCTGELKNNTRRSINIALSSTSSDRPKRRTRALVLIPRDGAYEDLNEGIKAEVM